MTTRARVKLVVILGALTALAPLMPTPGGAARRVWEDQTQEEPMPGWTDAELTAIGDARAIDITTLRGDGTHRRAVTIWVVRVGDDLYVRSVRGRPGGWFRHAVHSLHGRIRVGGAEREVAFEEPDRSVHPGIDDAYRTKYRTSPSSVAAMITPDAAAATFRLLPR
jgi:hypothetical protein